MVLGRLSVAERMREIGRLLRLRGEKPFRARAYERAAQAIEAVTDGAFFSLVDEGRLTDLAGVGPALSRQIEELTRTGSSDMLSDLREEFPRAIVALSSIPGVSMARARKLHEALGVEDADELAAACREGRVREVPGFGAITEAKLASSIERYRTSAEQVLLYEAGPIADSIIRYLVPTPARIAGDVRRATETTDEISIVAASDDPRAVLERFTRFPLVARIDSRDDQRVAVRLTNGARAVVWCVSDDAREAALLAATGPDDFVLALERRARARGVDLWRRLWEGEDQIFRALDLQPIAPELRDHPDALDLASRKAPLRLLEAGDLRGIIHCHSTYSDGRDDIETMARTADELGVEYLTITDHSPAAHYAGGVELERLERQWDEIADVQSRVRVKLLRGTESDILGEGALDYSDAVLEKLDVVIASVHSRMQMDPSEMTRRLVHAMRLPVFKIWGHPLGRLLLRREPFACDVEAVLDAAAESRAAIEINGDPYRLDLAPHWVRAAKERGLKFVVSNDAHSAAAIRIPLLGVAMARRGGLGPDDVLNTMPAEAFLEAVRPAPRRERSADLRKTKTKTIHSRS